MLVANSRFTTSPQTEILTAASKILSASYKKQKTSSFPFTKTASYLYNYTKDLSTWLNALSVVDRNLIYETWMSTRKLNPNRIRNSVLIHNIHPDITCADIYLICSAIGTVLDVYKPNNGKNIMFVDFEEPLSVPNAIKELHQIFLNGYTIGVEIPRTSFTQRSSSMPRVTA
jgi:hypothetical protein